MLLACLAAGAVAAASPLLRDDGEVRAFPDHPPVAHTGGFGEPTCRRCHTGRELNAPGGSLALEGAPAVYEPGKRYRLAVLLAREGMAAGGFQLAARCEDGRQAGELSPAGAPRVGVADDAKTGVRYAHQTADGVEPERPGSTGWELEWTAPDAGCGAVRLDVAANAANGDDSALGDYVYVRSLVARLNNAR